MNPYRSNATRSEVALRHLGGDVAVFVGDFGEEDVSIVKRVARYPQPKVAILGNHDAWQAIGCAWAGDWLGAPLVAEAYSCAHQVWIVYSISL